MRMKKNYLLVLWMVLGGLNLFAQMPTKLSIQRAKKIALQKNYNEEETARFIERATSVGINLAPGQFPTAKYQSHLVTTAINMDFEQQNLSGWSGSYAPFNCTIPTPNQPDSMFLNFTGLNNPADQTGICTNGNDPSVTAATLACVCPNGGLASCRLGDVNDGCGSAYISQSFVVTAPDTLITVYYAVILYDGHPAADAPKFSYKIKTAGGLIIDSIYVDAVQAANPNSGFFPSGLSCLYYLPWTSKTSVLSAFIGQTLTIDFFSSDCNGGAHRGYAYIDCKFGGNAIICGGNQSASLCFVTTNDSLKNEIYFNHNPQMPSGSSTIVYRQNSMSTWDSIGAVPYNQPDVFTDITANPNQQAYTYCVGATDSCSNKYAKSPLNTTIFMQSSMGTGSSINLSWSGYVGVSTGTYYIYRGSSPSSMTYLNQVSSSTFAYTDLNPLPGNNFYKINFVAPSNCTSNAPHGPLVGSNYKSNTSVGIGYATSQIYFNVYPSPANATLTIECSISSAEFLVTDLLGNNLKQITHKGGKTISDISDLPNGVYVVSLKDSQNKTFVPKRFVVQH